MAYFPMMIDIEDKSVLIVGGGPEAKKKAEILNMFGARVTVVAKHAAVGLSDIADNIYIREYKDSDIEDGNYALVVAATSDTVLNERISAVSRAAKIPVNVVDDAGLCTFIFPAIIKDKDVVCAVSSGGKSPYLAQHVKKLIDNVLPDNIGSINDTMGQIRKQAKEEIADTKDRREFLRKKLDYYLTESTR
ncbi:MAG: bifunctional precorrin-2 dehydrogenase/sirohydrochlorin ferrochelatase [Lachnospiraceae bacterium]|nr:bifunctional precorrin-2 dehydrogenase/sirohydrochlorin ferrochelatase [Lachnospiraceae bacterium]